MTSDPVRVLFHEHARERMALRGISEQQVHDCLFSPDTTAPGHRDRTKYTKRGDDGRISVVAVVRKISDIHFVVYTVFREDETDG